MIWYVATLIASVFSTRGTAAQGELKCSIFILHHFGKDTQALHLCVLIDALHATFIYVYDVRYISIYTFY